MLITNVITNDITNAITNATIPLSKGRAGPLTKGGEGGGRRREEVGGGGVEKGSGLTRPDFYSNLIHSNMEINRKKLWAHQTRFLLKTTTVKWQLLSKALLGRWNWAKKGTGRKNNHS